MRMFRRAEPQLSISGRHDARPSGADWPQTWVLSIHDGEGPPEWCAQAGQTVSLLIPDTTPGRSGNFWRPEDARLYWPVVRDFARHTHLHVHCHAGVSRSPALAAGALRRAGHHAGHCWDLVFAARPQAQPNLWITQLADPSGNLLSELMRRSPERILELQVMNEALASARGG